jgi:hypothetical protein
MVHSKILDVGIGIEGYGARNQNWPNLKFEKRNDLGTNPPNWKNESRTESHI